MPLLDGNKLLPPAVVLELHAAYSYLRRLENRIQMLADAQDHQLPKDELARMRIALAMGAKDWPSHIRKPPTSRGVGCATTFLRSSSS